MQLNDKTSLTFIIDNFTKIWDEEIEYERNLIRAEAIFKYFINLNLLDKSKINFDHVFKTEIEINEILEKEMALVG